MPKIKNPTSLHYIILHIDFNNVIIKYSITTKENAMGRFGFYTFKDEGYFDRLRNNAFSAIRNTETIRLSHPLPIKYSFTILGTSGIRRGDMFNINGIPNIYASKGLFQDINVSHQLDGMSWKTTVDGQKRKTGKTNDNIHSQNITKIKSYTTQY